MKELITKKQTEKVLIEVFRKSLNPICISDLAQGTVIEANNAFLNYFGFKKREEIIGKTTIETGLMKKKERLMLLKEVKEKGHAKNVIAKIKARDNKIHFIIINSIPIAMKNRKCLLTVGTDVSRFKLAKRAGRSNLILKSLDSIDHAGVVLISGYEKEQPSLFYMNSEAKKVLKKHPMDGLLRILAKDESTYISVGQISYHVRKITTHDHAPLQLIVMERLPDNLLIKRKIRNYDLTDRQQDVALLCATGHSNTEIAQKLCIGAYTVKDHIKEVFKIIGIHNRCELFPKLLNLR